MTSVEKPNYFAKIKAHRAFEALSDANKKYLSEHALIKKFKKSELLWRKQDPGEFCALVVDGLVEIISSNQNGEEMIMGIFGPGDLIGLSAIIKRINYPASAQVISKSCEVLKLFIRSIDLDLSQDNRVNMMNWEREKLLIHEQILRDKIMILGAGQVHFRLLELFDHLRMRFSRGQDSKAVKILIPIPITKTQISKFIEARVETVTRVLNKWEKAGYLIMDDQGITLKQFSKLKESDGAL